MVLDNLTYVGLAVDGLGRIGLFGVRLVVGIVGIDPGKLQFAAEFAPGAFAARAALFGQATAESTSRFPGVFRGSGGLKFKIFNKYRIIRCPKFDYKLYFGNLS